MIDTCKQFNTKEADTLQTTEFSKIPKIFWDIRIALLFEIFCKAEVFFKFVKPKFQKTSSFPFWNFGKLEVFLEFSKIPKKLQGFFLNLIPKHQKSQSFF